MKKRPAGKKTGKASRSDVPLYTLEVCILSGPMTRKFVKKNRVVSRTIQIRGNQTLQQFHWAIFHAFDREEEHMYEFQIGGKGPMDQKARAYVLPMAMVDPFGEREPAGDVTRTTVGSLGLKVKSPFGYWFDFGDDWWHQVKVVSIEKKAGRGRYPRVTERVGESPPQYVELDSER
jgi:pRiA4b ORF-3-like protein